MMPWYGSLLIIIGVYFFALSSVVFAGKTSERFNRIVLGILALIEAADCIWKAAKVIQ